MSVHTLTKPTLTTVAIGHYESLEQLLALVSSRMRLSQYVTDFCQAAPYEPLPREQTVAFLPIGTLMGQTSGSFTYRAVMEKARERLPVAPLSIEAALVLRLQYQQPEGTRIVAGLAPAAKRGTLLLLRPPSGPRLEWRGMHSVLLPAEYIFALAWCGR